MFTMKVKSNIQQGKNELLLAISRKHKLCRSVHLAMDTKNIKKRMSPQFLFHSPHCYTITKL